MMSCYEHAKSELERMPREDGDTMQARIEQCILDVVEAFTKPAHSGSSWQYTKELLFRLLSFKPLAPLTGEDDEWTDCRSYGEPNTAWQNKRCPEVFKRENGTAWYLNKGEPIDITFPFTVPD